MPSLVATIYQEEFKSFGNLDIFAICDHNSIMFFKQG